VAACRTPIGMFNGALSNFTAPQLGTIATKAAFDRCKVPKEMVDEVIFGSVLQANLGQNPARQVCVNSGLPLGANCTTVNKVCSSGLKSICYASQSIELGLSNVVVAGGMESMSKCPYYATKLRFGARMGNTELVDGMLKDGLQDPFTHEAMGMHAELCAREHNISRKQQDDYSIDCYHRAQAAYKSNKFELEVVSIEIPSKKGPPTIVNRDEGCWKLNEEKLRNLKPAFDANGTVTAGNSSQLSDGAASVIVVSEEIVKQLNLKPLARILSYADYEQASKLFPTSPSLSVPKALQRAGISMKDITEEDFFEINEAFAVVSLVNRQLLNINPLNMNIYGGAVSLGHPIGCSGARLIATLITVLKQNNGRYGIVGICNGGGGSTAMVIENLH